MGFDVILILLAGICQLLGWRAELKRNSDAYNLSKDCPAIQRDDLVNYLDGKTLKCSKEYGFTYSGSYL